MTSDQHFNHDMYSNDLILILEASEWLLRVVKFLTIGTQVVHRKRLTWSCVGVFCVSSLSTFTFAWLRGEIPAAEPDWTDLGAGWLAEWMG